MLSSILYAIGASTIATVTYRFYCFIHLYFIHQSTLSRYLHGKDNSYALVTGASDGIGYAMAIALQKRGFNVILHGRNPEKLLGISKQMTKDFPNRRTVIVAADAMDPIPSVEKIAKTVDEVESSGGKLTVLVNNIGGGATLITKSAYTPLSEMEPTAVQKLLHFNATFPTILTNVLLPKLIVNGPSLILNHSSYAGVYHMPYLSIYSASKAFNISFSASLSSEVKMLGADVEVLGINIGSTMTPGNPGEKPGFSVISPDELAEGALARVGCGKRVVAGAFKHAASGEILKFFPDSLSEGLMRKEIASRVENEKKST